MLAKPEIESYTLTERYDLQAGTVLLTGIQALVRALMTRAHLDRSAGLRTGGFVSGYRGSPLGGLDKELWAQQQSLQALGIQFQPGVNEDLAATAVWGSQQVGLHAGATVDGAFGMWYGKAPGLDRSCDAIRHANSWGTSAKGGVLLVVGDDPAAKSSSLATQSEFALQDLQIPVLAPSDVQDVLDLAVQGWAMSRYAGVWVGLKAIADHMDSAATVAVDPDRYASTPIAPGGDVHIRRIDTPAEQEQRMLAEKLPRVLTFARAANINRWETRAPSSERARLGVICAGKAYRDVREACSLLGWHDLGDIRAAGVEILKLGMTWPLDAKLVREFADAVDMVLVVEEKRAFVEPQVKAALYDGGLGRHVPVLGKLDRSGKELLASTGILDVMEVCRALGGLMNLAAPDSLVRADRTREATRHIHAPAKQERTPLFCAGCPHNTSTRVPQGSRATAGIGCHYMVQWMDRDTDSCTHMGGEGVTWVGESPFTSESHIFANLGDGTYFHSGVLAIRQAVAAGVNITYKILFNDAVAMTGGQPTDGELTVAGLIEQLKAEGVAHVVVVSDQPERHAAIPAGLAQVYHRRDLDAVQRRLREVPGVSVLVYEQTCATELRRRRKRGLVRDERPRVLINEAVCEGCGDCTAQSNCVAVEPVETAFGIKRKINQTTCNKDLSCATGFCPAFVEVRGDLRRIESAELNLDELRKTIPLPEAGRASSNVLITGVGGTGIVTLSALLAAAARMDGKAVRTLDMTGLAQKGGAVFSHVRIAATERDLHVARIVDGGADLLVGCDLISAAADEALALLSDRTAAVINTHVTPTADFVLSQSHDVQLRKRLARVRSLVGDLRTFAVDGLVEDMLGDAQQANVFLLGSAYQTGRIPLSLQALERAIEVNGVAVQRNMLAFHLGRQAAADERLPPVSRTPAARRPETVQQIVEQRAEFLTGYQDDALAQRYRKMVQRVAVAESGVRAGSEQLTRAVAETYGKLLAIKDEYEVARLYLQPEFTAALAQFEPGARIGYLLAPPLFGNRKRRFGGWMRWVFKALAAMRGLRNTILDPFALTSERRQALELVDHYEGLIDELLSGLNLQNLNLATRVAGLAQQVRGFGHVKSANLQSVLAEEGRLMTEFTRPPEPVRVFDPQSREAA